ncbi:MAG: hypothetical protein GC172_01615 [Phycisphaera sp.]|nr:hypothetical protein [Phycisphaera sp.]
MTPLLSAIVVVHACATLFMTGLIWFVQVVHYPLFARVGAEGFTAYSDAHQRLTTLVVGPAMLIEATTAALLVFMRPPAVSPALLWAGLALLGAIWLSTAFVQVPLHGRLAAGFSSEACHALVSTNWIRTVAWSARALLVALMLVQLLGRGSAA